jgi:hypothetical protein
VAFDTIDYRVIILEPVRCTALDLNHHEGIELVRLQGIPFAVKNAEFSRLALYCHPRWF